MKSPRFFGKPKRLKPTRGFFLRRVVGDSMLPALQPGQIVLVLRTRQALRPGDVVVVEHGGLEKIKRIKRIEMEGSKQARVFLLGDNPGHSTDSRTLGWFARKAVVGKVLWPRCRWPQREASEA